MFHNSVPMCLAVSTSRTRTTVTMVEMVYVVVVGTGKSPVLNPRMIVLLKLRTPPLSRTAEKDENSTQVPSETFKRARAGVI